ncbi:MAG: hypothetical protein JO246_04065 [Frankiaceae bacterium]|nr:hypothetical protein [Frankiaceae bacterium]MBV9870385.1 hypothetical protein [Frankiaceae bacterium]
MYVWLWRRLPGGIPGKLTGCAVLLVAVVAVLFLVVFPWASPRLPFNHVTVNTPQSPSPQVQQTDKPAVPT